MKLKIALLSAGAALALAGVAFAGDKDKTEETFERQVIVVTDGGPGDHGPGEHDMMFIGGPMHGKMDANGDGVITKAEFAAMHDGMFAKLDKNNDGKLDKDEMDHGPMMRGPGGPGGPGGPHGPMRIEMRHGGPDGGKWEHGPEDFDANKDGKVSFEEFAAPLRDAFTRMDKDKSGFLEKGEQPDGRHVEIRRIERSDKK